VYTVVQPQQHATHTYSESHGLPAITTLLLPPVDQYPLQQHLGQLFLPGMLGLHQCDGLSQRRPLSSDQPIVQSIQQPLLGPTRVLDVGPEGCAHIPLVPTARTRQGAPVTRVGTREDPLEEAACPGARGDSG